MTFQMNDGTVLLGTQCPSTILTIKSNDSMIDPELRKYATELINKPFPNISRSIRHETINKHDRGDSEQLVAKQHDA